ncbi:MAG: NmrA family NAD(P)-binding protein [Verrucomicrobia bacterium]|nr:NmrA family NAD(P)-binding protein [Verrucomicrobiota bacterium]
MLFIGASGLIGSFVTPELIKAGFSVSTAGRRGLSVGGATGIAVDLRDYNGLARAMQDVGTVALVLTDAPDMESLGLNAVNAAKAAGARRLLWFSSFGAKRDNQARFSRRHPVIDEAVRASGIPYTILRPNYLMQNFTFFYGDVIRTTGTIFLPLGDARISHLDLRDLAEAAAAALTEDRHINKTYDLSGPEALHTGEVAEQIGAATGRAIRYQPISVAEMEASFREAGLDAWFAEGLAELYGWIRDSGLGSEVTDGVEHLLGRKAKRFRQFAADERTAWLD